MNTLSIPRACMCKLKDERNASIMTTLHDTYISAYSLYFAVRSLKLHQLIFIFRYIYTFYIEGSFGKILDIYTLDLLSYFLNSTFLEI